MATTVNVKYKSSDTVYTYFARPNDAPVIGDFVITDDGGSIAYIVMVDDFKNAHKAIRPYLLLVSKEQLKTAAAEAIAEIKKKQEKEYAVARLKDLLFEQTLLQQAELVNDPEIKRLMEIVKS